MFQMTSGGSLQRLFSMFPNGWPGRGLLLLRITNGVFAIHFGVAQLLGTQHSSATLPLDLAAAIAGILLLVGIWTPIVGGLLAAIEMGILWLGSGWSEDTILSAAIALSIAMLGPGVWSVDAAIFGRQRLEFPRD
jgi:putative oxidoreductase